MQHHSVEKNIWLVVLLALVLLSCSLVYSPGTLDVHTWSRWIRDYLDYSPVAGYAHNETDYPPLMVFIFYLFAKAGALAHIGIFGSVKITILFFSILSTSLVFYWTRSYAWTALFHLSFILDSVCLGYADLILGFFLILALLQLREKNIAAFSVTFALSVFIKWQALIISPFLFLYVLNINSRTDDHPAKNLKVALLAFTGISSVIIFYFGTNKLWSAFTWAFHHPWLSANALNMHWVLTFLYQAFYPEQFGALHNGKIFFITAANPPSIFIFFKVVFALLFSFTVLAFYRSKKNMEDLLLFSLTGYLMYFTFYTGVHENHLFLAVILSLLLASGNKHYFSLAIYLLAAFNMNMFLFYGFNGHFSPPRVIAGALDVSLLLALANTFLFTKIWFSEVARKLNA